MKSINLFGIISLFCLGLLGCDSSENESAKNYWERSPRSRMELLGKVKTLTITEVQNNSTEVVEFSESGLINSITTTITGNYPSTTSVLNIYSDKNQLIRTISDNNGSIDTVNYEYATHGKYIPMMNFHLWMTGLTPNLAAIYTSSSRTDYTFVGDSLYIITNNTQYQTKDTAIFAYSGNYPISSDGKFDFIKDLTYMKNGMFKNYSEGFKNTEGNSTMTREYTFMSDELRMLPTIIKETNHETSTITTTNFNYNEQKDITIRTEGTTFYEEYLNYVYDDKGNWTSRQYKYKYDQGEWTIEEPTTRTIVYWE